MALLGVDDRRGQKARTVAFVVRIKCLEAKTRRFFAIYDILTTLATR